MLWCPDMNPTIYRGGRRPLSSGKEEDTKFGDIKGGDDTG